MHTHALVHINTYDFALFQQMIAVCIESFIRLQLYYMRLVHAINLPCDCTERASARKYAELQTSVQTSVNLNLFNTVKL